MKRASLAAISLLTAALLSPRCEVLIGQGSPPARRVEILFLGHTRATEVTDPKAGGWYHDSDRLAPMLKAALAPDGFNFSYTTDLADLNPANLAKYDALLRRASDAAALEAATRALSHPAAGVRKAALSRLWYGAPWPWTMKIWRNACSPRSVARDPGRLP